MKTLNETQVRNLLLAAKGTGLEALLHITVTTGLRMGEVIGLKWEDLDMTSGTLRVQRQVQREKIRDWFLVNPNLQRAGEVIISWTYCDTKVETPLSSATLVTVNCRRSLGRKRFDIFQIRLVSQWSIIDY